MGCGIPNNGGGPCLEGDRLDAIEAEQRRERLHWEELREVTKAQASDLGAVKDSVHALEGDMLDQVAAVAGVVGELRGLRRDLFDRELRPRAPLVSIDWDRDEPTLHGDLPPDTRATQWAGRARETADKLDAERAARQLAELKAAKLSAQIEERDRHSEHARDDSRWAWSMRTKVIIAIATSGSVGAAIGAIAKWLL